ncbi:hypothetical protein [Microbacterium nymphoidis]|uniref:hypothetical protein n=1 Tax=Microbacterium nymphoidis TaxID=2898586 RepID=UPI001E4D9509|nr:hypothetical protein [Microbacterium nymphoidis]MCD2498506.1 hypothetical protein [Microbacterium nymphoidis]
MTLMPFTFLTATELDALSPSPVSKFTLRALHLGNEIFHIPRERDARAALEIAGQYGFEDARGGLHVIPVTAEQQGALVRAAHALRAPASYVLAYVSGITDVHPALHDVNPDVICPAGT